MKKLLMTMALFAMAVAPAQAAATMPWQQDFESDTAGWYDANSSWYGLVTRVTSGTDGIFSPDGGYYVKMEGDEASAPFSRFAGYSNEWPGTWTAQIDIYLDPSWDNGTGFDYSVAATGSDGNHQRDYIFHVAKDSSTSKLYVAGSNNSNFAPREDLENLNHYEIPQAGWYTFRHTFREQAGALAVDLTLINPQGLVVFTETRFNPADTIPFEVGGNRYAWFTFIDAEHGIAVDNHALMVRVAPPVTKDQCKEDAWKNFNDPGFKNQGDCVSYVQSNAKAIGNKAK